MARLRDQNRLYDIVLWGATGFTGELVAEYLNKGLPDSGIRLALDGAGPESDGGILTPATAMGMALVDRLRRAGMVFQTE